MENTLIFAVSGFPVLYDSSLFIYRDKKKKADAWKKVSDIAGISDDCKKRWKNLRDTYRREINKEEERCRSGAEASTHRPWRYSKIMGFLNPFIQDRATSSNLPASGSQGQGDSGEGTATSQACSEGAREGTFTLLPEPVTPEPEAPSPTPTPVPTPTSTPSTCRERSRPVKRPHDGSLSPFERQLICAVDRAVTQTTPPDPDRQFFDGLLPDVKALSARRKAEVKFQIHKLIFDAACEQFDEEQ